MPKAVEFAVDASVVPSRVVGAEPEDQLTELGRGGWSAGSGLWWLCPVAGDKAAVPADHRGGLHDQHHAVELLAVEGTRQHAQDRPVCRGEPRPLDLPLEDEDLMAEGEDLGVALVTGHEQQPQP
jgi:hypothetical protein